MTLTEFYGQLYDLLQEHVGASLQGKDDFVSAFTKGRCHEYRFQGSIGFGGKLYCDSGSFSVGSHRVGCYTEELPGNEEKINMVNGLICDLEETYNKEKSE